MTRRDIRAFLFDIEQACGSVADFTANKALSDYLAEPMLRSAVERQFEIIGEALNQALSVDLTLRSQITGASSIIAFRNRLIHGYATVAHETVWGIVHGKLPLLRQEVAALLSGAQGDVR
ncbi:MAG: hypothetical protein B7Z74_10570 [Deltaproteobacteria bacterium 21-66-5]|nr:MAG: hypothetical protein B7Z74_10570 [Deltaproteobacteria bacterium 21-66-5]HQT95481.1 DUF86 domain-containing protein [Thermoanaerobaculaceae bacterium]